MNMIAKKLSITLLTAVTAFAPLTSTAAHAESGAWQQENRYEGKGWRDNYRQRHHGGERKYRGHRGRDRHDDNKDAIVLGIIGLGAAAIIGGAIANSNNNPRVIYQQPTAPRAASGRGSYEPWNQSWFRYCSNKYRSFNAATGTYRGYDGRDHFCVAN